MKNSKTIGLIVLTVIVVVVLGQYLLNKFLNIMLLNKLVPFIKNKEGGLSRDPNDTAAKHPAPFEINGKYGWHTNKGITWQTFSINANRLGYVASKENFVTMPDDIWLKILKGVYMKAFPLDKIAHLPRIQAIIITWAWGSGTGGAERYLAKFQREVMGIRDSNITPTEIIDNFKRHINPLNEREWFNKLCDRRLEDFKKMATWSVHGTGWSSRLREFRALFN